MNKISLSLVAATLLAGVVLMILGGAVIWGGPSPIAALDSVNQPFAGLDYSAMPQVSRFTARDGTQLAYRHYLAGAPGATSEATAASPTTAPPPRRIVLIHGSSASSRSLHPMAMALQAAGFTVDALDVRGHGDSVPKGHVAYIGQLEDDLADFIKAVPFTGPNTLVGFSAGAGFALRFSASPQQALFDRYVLLAPFLIGANSNRPGGGGWASVGIPRIVALTVLNRFGISRWNHLPVTQFALNAEASKILTQQYSYALATNFGAHLDYADDIKNAAPSLKLLAGVDDELMFSERYAAVFQAAGKTVPVTLVPGASHIGLTLNPPALAAIVKAALDTNQPRSTP